MSFCLHLRARLEYNIITKKIILTLMQLTAICANGELTETSVIHEKLHGSLRSPGHDEQLIENLALFKIDSDMHPFH